MTAPQLDTFDILLASVLILINGGVSWAFNLGLERSLAVAAVRSIVQLLLVGLILKFVFEASSPLVTAAFAMVMAVAAAYEVLSRQDKRIRGATAYALAAATPFLSGLVTTLFATVVIMQPDPWYAPQYLLPLLGMVMGNTLTGVSLVLSDMVDTTRRERNAIEARLSLGATRYAAMQPALRKALKMALMPTLNVMAASGIVWLPGMMTGQILAGADPIQATKYQILIMFLIAGATTLAALCVGVGALLLLTDERHRLRLDRVVPR
jgi:putative ABC transport system permease protein